MSEIPFLFDAGKSYKPGKFRQRYRGFIWKQVKNQLRFMDHPQDKTSQPFEPLNRKKSAIPVVK